MRNKEKDKQRYIKNREKILEQCRVYRESHKEERAKLGKIRNIEMREIVFNHYDHKCQWPEGCDIIDSNMLQVDHVKRNGKHIGGNSLYQIVIKSDFSNDFRILCANHNWEYKLQYQKKPDSSNKQLKKIKNERENILDYYGHKCNWPGGCEWNITNYSMLHIHHKNGGGDKHRKEKGGYAVIKDIINNNSYDEYLPLCPNHHSQIHKEK